ncbi:Gmad2 immunoglobulin-like domain-containing protein, partial [Roseicyclus sp.]|uniref:Gmad2 immunoglobulin-like domain-containing protein n=1 Tax=Roseicyclus sp. TaxID=1914329 RepID=UPI003F9FAC73
LVVPGWPGSCSQKWLTRIELLDHVHDGTKMEAPSYQVPAYPVAPGTDVPLEDFEIINAMPVKSLVTHPQDGAETGTEFEVRGHAWAGDRTVSRMEVSSDYGESWQEAELDAPVNDGAWQNWRTTVTVPQPGYYEIWARATDSEGVMQPFAIRWNPKGYLNNSFHRVAVQAGDA